MEYPLVSVIIPTYSRPTTLCRALESVINQTYPNVEILVVDDNGKGTQYQLETEKVLQKYIQHNEIKYLVHPTNLNGSAARNTGFKNSKGEFVNFVDDDDVLNKRKIELQVKKLLESSEEYGSCYCWVNKYAGDKLVDQRKWEKEGNLLKEFLLDQVSFHTTTHLFRRSVVERLNGFDETFIRNQDVEFLTRFFFYYKICVVKDEILVNKYTNDAPVNRDLKKTFFDVREKYISTFSDYFNKLNYSNEIYYHFYYTLSKYAARYGFFLLFVKYIREMHKYDRHVISEIRVFMSGWSKYIFSKVLKR